MLGPVLCTKDHAFSLRQGPFHHEPQAAGRFVPGLAQASAGDREIPKEIPRGITNESLCAVPTPRRVSFSSPNETGDTALDRGRSGILSPDNQLGLELTPGMGCSSPASTVPYARAATVETTASELPATVPVAPAGTPPPAEISPPVPPAGSPIVVPSDSAARDSQQDGQSEPPVPPPQVPNEAPSHSADSAGLPREALDQPAGSDGKRVVIEGTIYEDGTYWKKLVCNLRCNALSTLETLGG